MADDSDSGRALPLPGEAPTAQTDHHAPEDQLLAAGITHAGAWLPLRRVQPDQPGTPPPTHVHYICVNVGLDFA